MLLYVYANAALRSINPLIFVYVQPLADCLNCCRFYHVVPYRDKPPLWTISAHLPFKKETNKQTYHALWCPLRSRDPNSETCAFAGSVTDEFGLVRAGQQPYN